ncbi:MAG TPA: Ig-like domain-containing protein [Gemmatimonadales bacterium]
MTRMFKIALLACAFGVAACSDSVEEGPDPVAIELVDGDAQDGSAGSALAEPLRVRVTDADGAPVAGVEVTWAVLTGGGSITPVSSTDAQGIAAATFTLGPSNGAHTASASVDGLTGSPVEFTAVAGGIVPPPPDPEITVAAVVPAPAGAVFIHDMFVRDGLAFVFAWNAGVRIYDVGNGVNGGSPTNPQLVGNLVTPANGLACVCVHNGWWFHSPSSGNRYLFLGQEGPGSVGAASTGDIHVIDVSNLAAPVEVAGYRHPDQPDANGTLRPVGVHNFWMDEPNEILYAAFYNGGVVAFDVSGTLTGDLSSRVLAAVRPGGAANTYTWGVQLANGFLYAIDMKSGLYQLQLQGNELEVLSGGNNVPGQYSSDLWVTETHAYTGTWGGSDELHVWTLDAGGAPTRTGTVTVAGTGTISDVEVSPDGSWLALTAEYGPNAGLHLYSLADPGNPVFIDRHLVASDNGGLHTGTIAQIGGRWYVFAARDPSPGGPALMILDVTEVLP